MVEVRLKKDWLAGNAVIAFLGALMLAQTWRPTAGGHQLLFNIAVPAYPDPMTFIIAAFLFLSSFLMAVASIIPIRLVPHWAISAVSNFSVVLDTLILLAFWQSWLTIFSELPDDQWWTHAFGWGGLMMLLFLGYRVFAGLFRVPIPSNLIPSVSLVGLIQWISSMHIFLWQCLSQNRVRAVCCVFFFIPFALYFFGEWSQLPERPLALDVGVVTVAAALGGLVLNAGLNLQGSKRKETVQVAQKFIGVVVLMVIFLPSVHFVDLIGGIDLGSFEPGSSKAWVRGFFFWIAAASFYGGIGLFIVALVDLVYAMKDIHNVKYASSGNHGASAENRPGDAGSH